MKLAYRLCGAIVATVAGLSISLTAATPAGASAGDGEGAKPRTLTKWDAATIARSSTVGLTACPVQGDRVKSSDGDEVYLIGTFDEVFLIPNATVYLQLWDSWSGVKVNDGLPFCFPGGYYELTNGHLLKSFTDPKVYLWDSSRAHYRWIVNADVFAIKYGFSWSKIISASEVNPIHFWDWT
jgi:hypothetical protein